MINTERKKGFQELKKKDEEVTSRNEEERSGRRERCRLKRKVEEQETFIQMLELFSKHQDAMQQNSLSGRKEVW